MISRDERWRRVREVFDRVVALEPRERSDLLDSETPEVRSEVERLIAMDSSASEILDRGTARGLVEAAWAATLAPGHAVGPYRLVRAIGSGGMGVVFEAEEESPRRRVALKTVRAEFFTPELLQRFANEVQMLARLDHSGIARIYATGTFRRAGQECPYYTMELVEDAQTILAFADREQLGVRGRLELFLQACDAVDHGHRKGVIHRDLKPGNLLVDAQGRLKVIDFGLARPDDPAALGAAPLHTKAGLVFGTLPYMSPEHVAGRSFEIDTQSDVHSLGSILCELLSGRPPHDLLDIPIQMAFARIESEDPRLPAELPRELSWIVGRAVARERSRRYPSVGDLAADVRRYLRREPVHAAPPSRTYTLRSFARRHRGLIATATAVMLALAIGLARAQLEARAAERARGDAELEAMVSSEVSTFLGALFTGMHAFSEGADARVSDVLEMAAVRLDEVERAGSRAILTGLVGQGYLNLGDMKTAEGYLSDAVALSTAEFAPDSIHRLRNESLWADWLEQTGHYGESRDLSADVLARGAGVLEVQDRQYASYNLAVCDSRLGDHRAAEKIFRELLAYELEREKSWASVINLTHRLGAELWNLGRGDEAAATYEDALAKCAQMPAGNELYAATIRMELAQIYQERGDLDEAERLLLVADAAYVQYGSPPSNRAILELCLARVRIERGALEEAADAMAAAEAHAAEVYGITRVDVYLRITDALWRAADNDLAGATEAAESALELAGEIAGPGSPLASEAFDVLAEIAEQDGGAPARIAVLRRGFERFRDLDPDDPGTLHRLELYARALLEYGRAAEAEPLVADLVARTPEEDPARAARCELRDEIAAALR